MRYYRYKYCSRLIFNNYTMKIKLENKFDTVNNKLEVAQLDLKTLLSFSEKTLLYFYPKDDTPWCTIENNDFSWLKNDFKKSQITLIWVSKDNIESHKKFIKKYWLKIDLISDPNLILHKEIWAYWEKNNYWKIVNWVIRSSFLLNSSWEILKEYKNIRAKWHALRLLNELKDV